MMKTFASSIRQGAFLLTAMFACSAYAGSEVQAVPQLDLKKYLGTWYEVARKPMYFQNKCAYNVTAQYSLNENGNVKVDNRYYQKDGKLMQSEGEAFVQNAPANSKLKVSFLPKALRWLPVGRGDYWVLKIDPQYQMALVGAPSQKYLWVLSRDPKPEPVLVQRYLDAAVQQGYDLSDIIYTVQQ
ncbi:lipocalin family protein [Acinetobacter tianfuensis]